MGLRMQPRNEKFFTLFSKAGSNVVESAAILMEFVRRAARALGRRRPEWSARRGTTATAAPQLVGDDPGRLLTLPHIPDTPTYSKIILLGVLKRRNGARRPVAPITGEPF